MIDPDKLDEALRLLNATLHEQLLATGLVTVEQWNAEIAPHMMAVASISVGSPVHARSYRVHESIYPPRAKAAEQEHGTGATSPEADKPSAPVSAAAPAEWVPFEWPSGTRPVVTHNLRGDVVIMDEVEDAPLLTINGHNGVDPQHFLAWCLHALAALPSLPADNQEAR